MTYRRRYFSRAQLPAVMDLLLAEEENPRALAFQLKALNEHSAALPQDETAPDNAEQQKIISLAAHLAETDLETLCEDRVALENWLNERSNSLDDLSETLTHHYFSHTVAQVS